MMGSGKRDTQSMNIRSLPITHSHEARSRTALRVGLSSTSGNWRRRDVGWCRLVPLDKVVQEKCESEISNSPLKSLINNLKDNLRK